MFPCPRRQESMSEDLGVGKKDFAPGQRLQSNSQHREATKEQERVPRDKA
jgi:hypothetical protein